MKRIGILSVAFAAMLTVACGGDAGTSNDTMDQSQAPAAGAGTPDATGTAGDAQNRMGQGDVREFVNQMAITNMAEVQLGKLAQERAQSPQVKQFADMMVKDHTKANEELKQVASKLNVQLPTELDEKHRDLADRLSKLQGAEFDREYMNAMVDGHEDAINKAEDRANQANRSTSAGGSDPNAQATGTTGGDMQNEQAVNQWATKTLPTLRQHLQRAEQVQQQVEKQQ
jgi:putative membrane protein